MAESLPPPPPPSRTPAEAELARLSKWKGPRPLPPTTKIPDVFAELLTSRDKMRRALRPTMDERGQDPDKGHPR